jgi:hypothetical protein
MKDEGGRMKAGRGKRGKGKRVKGRRHTGYSGYCCRSFSLFPF